MPPARPPLLGRERELAVLVRALSEPGSAILLEGELGLGKTRLCQELDRLAAERGHRVVWARAWDGGPPGWPWGQILRGLGAASASGDIRADAVLEALGAAAPAVVILDDAHRLDPVSRELLAQVAGAPGALVVAAALPGAQLGDSTRLGGSTRLTLAPLDDETLAALLDESPDISPARARAILARAAGNPRFLRALCEVEDPATEVPAEIASAIAAVLDALSPEVREAAQIAAVAGPALAPRLAGAGALAEVGDWLLSQGLVRDAIYRGIPIARRAALHHEAARAAEHDRPPADVALHARLGASVGGRAPVAHWEHLAGQAAAARREFDEADAHFSRALAAAEPGTLARCEILIAAGSARNDAGDHLRAVELFATAAPLARKLGDPRLLARMALSLGRRTFTPARPNQPLIEYSQEALAGLGASEPALRARLLARLGSELAFSAGGAHVALTHEAIALARSLADPALLATVLVSAHTALWTPENLDEREAIADEIEALTAQLDDPDLRMRGLHTRVIALVERGDLTGAARALAQCSALAEQRRDATVRWLARVHGAMIAHARGRLDEAEQHGDEARALGEAAGSAFDARTLHTLLLWGLRRDQDRVAELVPRIEALVAEVPRFTGWRYVLADVRLRAGDRDGARALFRELLEGLDAVPRDLLWLGTAVTLGELAAQLGEVAAADRLYDVLLPFRDRVAVQGRATLLIGPVALTLGRLAALQGRREARAHLERARALAGEMPLVLARITDALAELELRLTLRGAIWHISGGGAEVRIPDSKGMRYLAELVREPGRQLHAADLIRRFGDPELVEEGDAGALVDERAQAEYRARIAALDAQLAGGRGPRAVREERDYLVAELARAVGLGRRTRRAGDRAERSRQSVTKCLRDAIKRIAEHDAALGRRLDEAIKTGRLCWYEP